MDHYRNEANWLGPLGCSSLLMALCLLCLVPLLFVELMQDALERLHLSPQAAGLALVGIFLGSLVNIPVYRIERVEMQPVATMGVWGFWHSPRLQRLRRNTIIAVNLGGCVIPVLLALRQILLVANIGGWRFTALGLVVAGNIVACYLVARPVEGVGIAMPGLVSPLVAVSLTWLLLAGPAHAEFRAPIAFVGGVLGPLVGADFLHLREITRISVGILSIGGAGTFDGIVLSGLLAAFVA